MRSVWMIDRNGSPNPRLLGAIEAEVVVVGGGITGVSTALRLVVAGRKVVLLEAGRIGAGNTGRSTGNLYGTVSSGLAPLHQKWDATVVRDVVAVRLQAIEWIERTAARLKIDCAFSRCPLFRSVAGADAQQTLEQEFDVAQEAKLAPDWVDGIPGLPLPLRRTMRIDGQAQFDPFAYVQGLGQQLVQRGAIVHENSAVLDINARKGLVRTAEGEVTAQNIVLATHTPKGFNLVQAEMEVSREYGVAGRLGENAGSGPSGICWVSDRSRSIRSHRHHGRDHVIAVGEKHPAGQYDSGADYAERLRETLRRSFDMDGFSFAWSAQQFQPADGLPYIGASGHGNVYIATGFSADGLTWGTVAAEIIGSLIAGRDSRIAELLSPRRFTPVKSARGWAAENAVVLRHLVADRFGSADAVTLADVGVGEGRIVDLGGGKHAVFRSAQGRLSVLSPVCPHLKCHVSWNPAEGTWDCPCHGSRFDTDGQVIEGPALQPLERRELDVGEDVAATHRDRPGLDHRPRWRH